MPATIKACQIKCDTRGRREKYSNYLSNLFPELALWERSLLSLTALTINFCLTDYCLNRRWLFHPPMHEHTNTGGKQTCTFLQIPAGEGGTLPLQVSIKKLTAAQIGSRHLLTFLKLKQRFNLFICADIFISKSQEISYYDIKTTVYKSHRIFWNIIYVCGPAESFCGFPSVH